MPDIVINLTGPEIVALAHEGRPAFPALARRGFEKLSATILPPLGKDRAVLLTRPIAISMLLAYDGAPIRNQKKPKEQEALTAALGKLRKAVELAEKEAERPKRGQHKSRGGRPRASVAVAPPPLSPEAAALLDEAREAPVPPDRIARVRRSL
jgi:hypothetical protein